MRWIFALLLVFSTIAGYQVLTRADRAAAVALQLSGASTQTQWRRTSRGWEQLEIHAPRGNLRDNLVELPSSDAVSAPHPLLIALLFGGASIGALYGIPVGRRRIQGAAPRPHGAIRRYCGNDACDGLAHAGQADLFRWW